MNCKQCGAEAVSLAQDLCAQCAPYLHGTPSKIGLRTLEGEDWLWQLFCEALEVMLIATTDSGAIIQCSSGERVEVPEEVRDAVLRALDTAASEGAEDERHWVKKC